MCTKHTKEALSQFKEYCGNNSLRYTPEREKIIEEIYSKDRHFDVDELYMDIRKKNPKIGKASIYRTIPLLVESGLLREVMSRDGHGCYEHTLGHEHHDHMYCLNCRSIIEFVDERIEKAQEEIAQKYRFSITKHTHVIEGYCHRCRSAKSKGSKAG